MTDEELANLTCTIGQLSMFVGGLNRSWLSRKLDKAGIVGIGNGRWKIAQCTSAILDSYRTREIPSNMDEAKLRKMIAEAEMAERENKKHNEELIEVERVAKDIEAAFRVFSLRMNQLPELLTVPLSGAKSQLEIKQLLKEYVRNTQTDIAAAMKAEFTANTTTKQQP